MLVFGLTKRLPTGGSCISNTLRTGRVVRYTTQVNFFNRKREIEKFKYAFHDEPRLHVVLGPPSTGKTSLIYEVTSKPKGDFNPLFINCRDGQFNTPRRIYDSITSQFEPFFSKNFSTFKDLFDKGEISFIMNNTEFKFKPSFEREITSNDVTKLLNNIGNSLPNWNIWKGNNIPPPILVIDEANMFSQLGGSEDGEVLLKSILEWMVVNTKEKQRFPIVLTSSDSFFFNWISDLLHIPHATPYVVGDLSKEEAEEYFEEYVIPQYECRELEGKFDHIRRITGTRMLIIKMYVQEYKNNGGKLDDTEFSIYESEYNRLSYGLYPKALLSLHKIHHSPPAWKDCDFIKTIEAIVEAKDRGFILQKDLVKEIGYEQVNSLVDYNFLHRRPTRRFANDIIDPPDKVILTAMNQPSLRAMEDLLVSFE